MLRQSKLLDRYASCILKIVFREEDCTESNVFLPFLPSHGVMLAVFASMIHVMHHIGVSSNEITVDYMSCQSQIAPASGKQQHIPCILVIERQVFAQISLYVVHIITHYILQVHMFLKECHIQIVDLHTSGNQVISYYVIAEAFFYLLCISFQCEVEEALLFGTNYLIAEVKVEILVHRKRSDRGNYIYILVGFILGLCQCQIDYLLNGLVLSKVTVCDLNGTCPQRYDVIS